jgi:hypothetical protein
MIFPINSGRIGGGGGGCLQFSFSNCFSHWGSSVKSDVLRHLLLFINDYSTSFRQEIFYVSSSTFIVNNVYWTYHGHYEKLITISSHRFYSRIPVSDSNTGNKNFGKNKRIWLLLNLSIRIQGSAKLQTKNYSFFKECILLCLCILSFIIRHNTIICIYICYLRDSQDVAVKGHTVYMDLGVVVDGNVNWVEL